MGFWDVLAKLGLAIVIVYLIAKALGIINSPPAVDVSAIIAGGYFVWRYATKLEKVEEVGKEVKDIGKDIDELRKECPVLGKE